MTNYRSSWSPSCRGWFQDRRATDARHWRTLLLDNVDDFTSTAACWSIWIQKSWSFVTKRHFYFECFWYILYFLYFEVFFCNIFAIFNFRNGSVGPAMGHISVGVIFFLTFFRDPLKSGKGRKRRKGKTLRASHGRHSIEAAVARELEGIRLRSRTIGSLVLRCLVCPACLSWYAEAF